MKFRKGLNKHDIHDKSERIIKTAIEITAWVVIAAIIYGIFGD